MFVPCHVHTPPCSYPTLIIPWDVSTLPCSYPDMLIPQYVLTQPHSTSPNFFQPHLCSPIFTKPHQTSPILSTIHSTSWKGKHIISSTIFYVAGYEQCEPHTFGGVQTNLTQPLQNLHILMAGYEHNIFKDFLCGGVGTVWPTHIWWCTNKPHPTSPKFTYPHGGVRT